MAEYVEEVRDRIEKALKYRDMKPVDLAKRTGFSEPKISQYRSGYAIPKRDAALILADALQVSPAWLLGFDVPMLPSKKKQGESGTAAERESLYIEEADSVICSLNEENIKKAISYMNNLLALQKAEDELK